MRICCCKVARLRDGQALPAVSRKDITVTFLLLLQPRRLALSFTAVIYLRCLLPSLFSAVVYYRRFISIVPCCSHFFAPSRAWCFCFSVAWKFSDVVRRIFVLWRKKSAPQGAFIVSMQHLQQIFQRVAAVTYGVFFLFRCLGKGLAQVVAEKQTVVAEASLSSLLL